MAVTTSSGNGFALYNGDKLLNINTVWTDKATCPKAYIVSMDGVTALFVSANPIVFDFEGTAYIYSDYGTACGVSIFGDDAWSEMPVSTDGSSEAPLSTVIWSNFDILNTDNTVHLSASDPIPLDGMTVIEWDGDKTGLDVGTYISEGADSGYSLYKVAEYVPMRNGDVFAVHFVASNGAEIIGADDYYEAEFGAGGRCHSHLIISAPAGTYTPTVGTLTATITLPSDGLYMYSSDDGQARTTLYAYPASGESGDSYDEKEFLSGLVMGLCSKGNPTFTASDVFGKGYLVGAELRRKRVLPGASVYLYGTPSDSGNIGLRSGESVSFYDGAVLPDINCLLTVEQKAKYPFLWIYGPYNAGRRYRMTALPKVEVHYSSLVHWFGVWGDDASYINAVWEDGQWGEATEKTGGTNTYVGADLWKNFDISYESEVLSSASPAPIPVSGIVAYSYNGTVLPELPESDLPNMYIYQNGESGGYVLVATQKPCKLEQTKAQYGELLPHYHTPLTVSDDGIAVEYTSYVAYENYTEWDLRSENNVMPNGLRISLPIIWSNYDFCYNDGEVYVAASPAPIPVYE